MTGPLTQNTRVVATRDQVSAELSGESVILSLRSGQYFGLDAVGHRVWKLAQAPVTIGALVDRVTAEFEAERTRVEADLLALVADLVSEGLLEVAEDADATGAA